MSNESVDITTETNEVTTTDEQIVIKTDARINKKTLYTAGAGIAAGFAAAGAVCALIRRRSDDSDAEVVLMDPNDVVLDDTTTD